MKNEKDLNTNEVNEETKKPTIKEWLKGIPKKKVAIIAAVTTLALGAACVLGKMAGGGDSDYSDPTYEPDDDEEKEE